MSDIRIRHVTFALAVVDVTLFVVANIPRYTNAKHGVDHILGGIFWMGFLGGTLTLLITLGVWIGRATRARRATS